MPEGHCTIEVRLATRKQSVDRCSPSAAPLCRIQFLQYSAHVRPRAEFPEQGGELTPLWPVDGLELLAQPSGQSWSLPTRRNSKLQWSSPHHRRQRGRALTIDADAEDPSRRRVAADALVNSSVGGRSDCKKRTIEVA